MDNKIILVIVAILIAAAAVAAFALSQNTEDTNKNFVTYYRNRRVLDETTIVKRSGTSRSTNTRPHMSRPSSWPFTT